VTSHPPPDVGVVIVAAGRSRRTGSVDKLWAPLVDAAGRSRPLLAYAVAPFQACPAVDAIAIVAADEARAKTLAQDESWDKVRAVVPGGARRQDSVRLGLEAVGPCTWVIVHDGARPLVTADLIERGLQEAQETGASCCALPVPDTIKEGDETPRVVRTLDRSKLWLAQTPQTFRYDLLMEAHRRAEGEATDDAALVEALGGEVRLYSGSPRNLKVTTLEDLELVQALLARST
jgi:2-C-methyl-D-erythritol 4-phosphate cytidylyltransferase